MTDMTADLVRSLLDYCPQTGALTWRARADNVRFSTKWGGRAAFTAVSHGYNVGRIFNKKHYAHRIAWLHHHGHLPAGEIDHINGRRNDNRIANLRDVSHAENNRNHALSSANTSGLMGVSFTKSKGLWKAQAKVAGKPVHVGYFTSKEAAGHAAKKFRAEHGYHENHGRIARQ